MADDATLTDDTTATVQGDSSNPAIVVIPPEVRQQFPDVIELIEKSESMNNGERQYWVDILPAMTPDQLQQLRDILTNERDQLAAIDQKYAKEIDAIGTKTVEETDSNRRVRRDELASKEGADRSVETKKAEDILGQME